MDHQKYVTVFSVYCQYLVTVCVSVCFKVCYQNTVCVSSQKPFPFHLGLALSYFPHYFSRKCGEKFAW